MLLAAESITKKLEGDVPVTLVKDVSLQIEPGEFVVIVGPSGSGKSSLLYLLGLLDIPSTGRIFLNNTDTSTLNEERLADLRLAELGFVFQFHFLLPEFSAIENVSLPMKRLKRLAPKEIHERAQTLLSDLGLETQTHKIPRQLSGGQSQRVAIARALANNPSIIFADEPTGNLDTAASANVQKLLKDLAHQKNKSVVAVTHDKDFAAGADRIITIVDGKIQSPG